MRPITLLVGVPGSGKTWVAKQLGDAYELVPNDDFIGKDYVGALLQRSERTNTQPILGECPFSVSQVADPLRAAKRAVRTVFIIESERVLCDRYFQRDRKPIPSGHLTRQKTYANRADQTGSFVGTSAEVLEHLKKNIE